MSFVSAIDYRPLENSAARVYDGRWLVREGTVLFMRSSVYERMYLSKKRLTILWPPHQPLLKHLQPQPSPSIPIHHTIPHPLQPRLLHNPLLNCIPIHALQNWRIKRLRDLQRIKRDRAPEFPPAIVQRDDRNDAEEANRNGAEEVGVADGVDGAGFSCAVLDCLRPVLDEGEVGLDEGGVAEEDGHVRNAGSRDCGAEGDFAHAVEDVLE